MQTRLSNRRPLQRYITPLATPYKYRTCCRSRQFCLQHSALNSYQQATLQSRTCCRKSASSCSMHCSSVPTIQIHNVLPAAAGPPVRLQAAQCTAGRAPPPFHSHGATAAPPPPPAFSAQEMVRQGGCRCCRCCRSAMSRVQSGRALGCFGCGQRGARAAAKCSIAACLHSLVAGALPTELLQACLRSCNHGRHKPSPPTHLRPRGIGCCV